MGFTLRKICNGKEIWVGKHNIVKFISTHSNSERSMGRMVTLKLTFTQPDCGWHQHEFKVDTNKNQADKWSRWALFIFSTSFVGFAKYSIKMIWLRNLQILSKKTVAKKSEFVTFINKNLQKSLWKCDIFYQVTWSHCTKWVSEEQRIGHGERPDDMVVYGHETKKWLADSIAWLHRTQDMSAWALRPPFVECVFGWENIPSNFSKFKASVLAIRVSSASINILTHVLI